MLVVQHLVRSLQLQQIIVINNLEPREFKAVGLTSYGMLLAADSESGPILLTVDKKAKAGAKIK